MRVIGMRIRAGGSGLVAGAESSPALSLGFSSVLSLAMSIIMLMGVGLEAVDAAITDVVHPAYELSEIAMPEQWRTMGMGFLSDGRLVLGTAQVVPPYGDVPAASPLARLIVISGVTGPAAGIQVKEIANNWMQITGVTIVHDTIYVADRDAQYRILVNETPADLKANRKKVVDWPDEGTWNRGRWWHQYLFTPQYYKGSFYAPYSGSIGLEGLSNVPPTSGKSGAFLKWDLAGKLEAVAGGLRSPNGLNIGPTGEMFVTDNQGGWFPSSTFSLIKPGKFYGHRNSTPNFAEGFPYQPPVAWLPHGDVRSSPTQPICVPDGAYRGDWLMGDANNPGLVRVNVDTVQGEYQGAVFWFCRGMGAAAINRLAWGPDGALYLGTIEHIGSLPVDGVTPMYRLAPKPGAPAFEMKAIRLLADGFEIGFTQPVDKTTAVKAAIALDQWKYVRKEAYGEGRVNDASGSIAAAAVETSADGMRIHVKVDKLTLDRVVHFKLTGIKSVAGQAPFDNEAWYTLNLSSLRTWNPAATGTSGRPRASDAALQAATTIRSARSGRLEVMVDLHGSYSLTLRGLDGSLEGEFRAVDPGVHVFVRKGAVLRLHLLLIRQGESLHSGKVLF